MEGTEHFIAKLMISSNIYQVLELKQFITAVNNQNCCYQWLLIVIALINSYLAEKLHKSVQTHLKFMSSKLDYPTLNLERGLSIA